MEAGDESATGSVNLFKARVETSGFPPRAPLPTSCGAGLSERRRSRHSRRSSRFRRLARRLKQSLARCGFLCFRDPCGGAL